jgi:hypothetical protein
MLRLKGYGLAGEELIAGVSVMSRRYRSLSVVGACFAAISFAALSTAEEIEIFIEGGGPGGIRRVIRPGSLGPAAPAAAQAADAEDDLALLSDGKHVSVRFVDGSALKLDLKQENYDVVTPYGKLTIPAKELRLIELAPRVPDEIAKQIEEAVANLGSPQFEIREKAAADLIKIGPLGYPVLLQFASPKDLEVAARMEDILDKVRSKLPDNQAEPRRWDVVHTSHSRISGHVDLKTVQAQSAQFGDVNLRLADVRDLYFPGDIDDAEIGKVEPAPQNLYDKANQIGKTFAFKVTGNASGGSVYGTDVYTLDSSLAAVAVHAGVVKNGATGVIRVKIIESPETFVSTTRNGVSSYPWGRYSAAYKVLKR